MSLADELLADLEESDGEDVEIEEADMELIPTSISNPIEEGYIYFYLICSKKLSFHKHQIILHQLNITCYLKHSQLK